MNKILLAITLATLFVAGIGLTAKAQCPEPAGVATESVDCGTATIKIIEAQFDVTYNVRNSSGSIIRTKTCTGVPRNPGHSEEEEPDDEGCAELTFAPVSAGIYSVEAEYNGCIRVLDSSLEIQFPTQSAATVTLTSSVSPVAVCEGSAITLTATPNPSNKAVEWRYLGPEIGATWKTLNAGLTFSPSGEYNEGTFKVIVRNDCDNPDAEESITVTRKPRVVKPTISFSTSISLRCKGDGNANYNASADYADSFLWSITNAGSSSITAGAVTKDGNTSLNTATAHFVASATTATIRVTAKGCGGSSLDSDPFIVTMHSIATKTATPAGPSTCASVSLDFIISNTQASVLYKLIDQNNVISDSERADDNGGSTISLSAPGPGTYTVKGTDEICFADQLVANAQTIAVRTPGTVTVQTSNNNATNVSVGKVCRGDGFKFTASGGRSYRWYWYPSDPNNDHDPEQSVGTTATFPASGAEVESGAYYLAAKETVCGKEVPLLGPYNVIQHDLPDVTLIKPLGTTRKIKSGASQSFEAVAQTNHTYKWFLGATQKASGSLPTYLATEEGNYTFTVTSPDGCMNTSTPFFLDINSLPVIQVATDNTLDMPASSYAISAQVYDPDGIAPSVAWQKLSGRNIAMSGGNSTQLSLGQLRVGTYQFELKATDDFGEVSTVNVGLRARVPGENYGFIRQEVVQVTGVKSASEMQQLPADSIARSITYVDGLGRKVQQVVPRASPGKNDIVTPFVYDTLGREFRQYLPVSVNNGGHFNADLLNADGTYLGNFYNNPSDNIADDIPFSQTVYENSPLNRVIEQGAPGAAWQPGTGHTIKKQYLTNGTEEVLLLTYDADTGLGTIDYYEPSTLSCTKTIDEHNNDILEFVDKEGRVVCKKVKATTGYASTYYIYDDLGNLVVVVPPEGVERILHPNGN